ncbi:MAG: methyltransferase domain-containing protein, partial [Armatimonadota bacterium]|nr:methyltransferase domain-containing protein [Armatimonadota bacterium]
AGPRAIHAAVTRRMQERQLECTGKYLALVQSAAEELRLLIDEVVVTETCFFRDREPFVFLERFVQETWLPSNQSGLLKAFSIPCSTGEEPFSIAICLRQAGLPAQNFWIDAVDISSRALAKARRGKYGRNSFRGLDAGMVHPFIRQVNAVGDRYEVDESIRRRVSFVQGNLFELPPGDMTYDVVFCRNLLIYLDQSARQRAMRMIARFLKRDGLLFVGQSEKSEVLSHGYVPANASLSCFKWGAGDSDKPGVVPFVIHAKDGMSSSADAGRKQAAGPSRRSAKAGSKKQVTHRGHVTMPGDNLTGKKAVDRPNQEPNVQSPPGLTQFDAASELADRGMMPEARRLCEAHLRENPVDANAYVLLGQVQQSLGNLGEAEQCFHKAVFLDPNHYKALTHLFLLKEHQGDVDGASKIRKRLFRVSQG